MSPQSGSSGRVLEPSTRVAEVLLGLIMVLAFPGSLSVAEAGRVSNAPAVTMLFGAGVDPWRRHFLRLEEMRAGGRD